MSKQKLYDIVYKRKAIKARAELIKFWGYFNLFKINILSQLNTLLV